MVQTYCKLPLWVVNEQSKGKTVVYTTGRTPAQRTKTEKGSGEMDDYVILITQLSLSTRRNNNYNISHFLPYLRDIR